MRRCDRISANKSSQKRNREEDEPLDLSKHKEKSPDKKKRSNEETNDASADTNKCSICLDTGGSSVMKSLPCAHVYHEICIDEWLKKSNLCPNCRCPANDSPHVGADGSWEEFGNYEDDSNRISVIALQIMNDNNFQLNVAGGDHESEDELGLYDVDDYFESVESHDDFESQESSDDFESEESSDESESEESSDESESEESSDDSQSEESSDESESGESSDEFDSDLLRSAECNIL